MTKAHGGGARPDKDEPSESAVADPAEIEELRREWALVLAHSSPNVRPRRLWAPACVLRWRAIVKHRYWSLREEGRSLSNPYRLLAFALCWLVAVVVLLAGAADVITQIGRAYVNGVTRQGALPRGTVQKPRSAKAPPHRPRRTSGRHRAPEPVPTVNVPVAADTTEILSSQLAVPHLVDVSAQISQGQAADVQLSLSVDVSLLDIDLVNLRLGQ